jgi:tetratricopeptide (TPR) repeat protein
MNESKTTLSSILRQAFSRSYHERGFVYGKMKKYKQAIADFKKALELQPDEETYRNNLEWAKNARRHSNKLIWSIVGAVIGAIIGWIVGKGYGAFFGAIIGAFPIPIIRFIWRWLSSN